MSFRECARADERPRKTLYNNEYFIYINLLKNEFKNLEEEINGNKKE